MAEQNPLRDDTPISIFSWDYKDKVTQSSIKRAFQDGLLSAEQYMNDEGYPAYKSPPLVKSFSFSHFFTLYRVHLRRAAPLLFKKLREEYYNIDESSYHSEVNKPYNPLSGLGLSGSLFFMTQDKTYVIKSVGRHFEYSFLIEQMLEAQAEHTKNTNGKTLLSEVTDVLFCFDRRIGGILNLCPSHYVVMTNMLKDREEKKTVKWDLKPQSFFEPNRDIIPEPLQSKKAQTGLSDELEHPLLLTKQQKEELMKLLERDSKFLEEMRTIDYSILLGRYAVTDGGEPPKPERHFTGITSADGKWVYQMCIVDYLWNVDKKQAKALRTAGKALPEQTITTTPDRYRNEFLRMMENYIRVQDDAE